MDENELKAIRARAEWDALLVVFGVGEIKICTAGFPDEPCDREIVFVRGEPGEIGRKVEKELIGQNTDEARAFLRFQFLNTESIDVLVDTLEALKVSMETGQKVRYG